MLAMESQQAIWLRCIRLAGGGAVARKEATRAVSEKALAASQAASQMMAGASPDTIVKAYRHKVRANVRRLSK